MCTGLGLEMVEQDQVVGLEGLVGLEEKGKVHHHHSRSEPEKPKAIVKRLGVLSPKRA